jgi:serine/threonine protein kinase
MFKVPRLNLTKLSEGSYGSVYRMNDTYALKRNYVPLESTFIGSIKEWDILNRCRGFPYIVQLIDVKYNMKMSPRYSDDEKDDIIYFVFELAEGDLDDIKLDRENKYRAMVHMLLAVEYIHYLGIIHRDIKPSNILKCGDLFKLADFGLSKFYNYIDPNTPRVYTYSYRAPEIILGLDYDFRADVWSLGCVIYELFSEWKLIPYSEDENIDNLIDNMPTTFKEDKDYILSNITDTIYKHKIDNPICKDEYSRIKDKGIIDILRHMLRPNPHHRLYVSEILNLPYFDSIREFINEVRKSYRPKPIIYPILYPERKDMALLVKNYIDIYPQRELFQAMDMYDRYCEYKRQQNQQLHPLAKYVCLYISIKYFNTLDIPPTFFDIIYHHNLKLTPDTFDYIEKLEREIINILLPKGIYRTTIYDICFEDKDLILNFYLNLTELSGINVYDVYRLYLNMIKNIEVVINIKQLGLSGDVKLK